MDKKEALLERFLRYVAIPTQSDPKAKTVPSNPKEFELAKLLAEELKALGFKSVEVSEFSVVTGKLPSNLPEGNAAPAVGWCAHMDTVDCGLSPEIHPQVIKNYQGGDICLNPEKDIWMRVADHPEVEHYKGDDIVVTDGTSVLGADNKSAIANVMTALSIVIEENRPHGDIYVAFVPDEEIGLRGAKKIDFTKFPVEFAYTIDSCELGEVVFETFNAGSATLCIKGVSAHPMSSKGVLVNPVMVAHDFLNLLEAKKALLEKAVEFLKVRHPKAEISYKQTDVYANIADAVTKENRIGIDYLYRALEIVGVMPKTIAMRGGTDGSFISSKGILTPNYFTGAHNFHSNCEFLPMSPWVLSLETTLTLIDLIAGTQK